MAYHIAPGTVNRLVAGLTLTGFRAVKQFAHETLTSKHQVINQMTSGAPHQTVYTNPVMTFMQKTTVRLSESKFRATVRIYELPKDKMWLFILRMTYSLSAY